MKRKGIILKRTPKIKIAFAIIGIAIGLLFTSVFVFDKSLEDDYKFEAQAVDCTYNHPICGWTGPGRCRTTPPSCYASEFACSGMCCERCCTESCNSCTPSTPTGYQAVTSNGCTTTQTSCTRYYNCSGNSCGTITTTWEKIKYAVNFNANGGSCSANQSICYQLANTAPTCTRTGYAVSYTQSGCGGTFNTSTGVCSSVTATTTITANWTNTVRVTYWESPNAGGTLSPTYRDVAYGASATGPTATPATGWSLAYFYIHSGSCAGTFTSSTGTCSNVQVPITIVAVWYNSPPTFTVSPYETVASYSTSPTAIGASLTFRARATDANASYYLIICSSNSVTAGASGAAPTCGATTYCNSSATASGSYATCSYTTSSGDAWSNVWYGFVCDSNVDQATCSSASQGSGNSGSPFFVNHAPSFSASSVSAAVNPGGTITWSTTSSDPDGNTIKLLVCKTLAMSSGSCTGGTWCTSSLVASNASCSYVATAPYADGSYDAYPYIVDQFNLGATGFNQGGIRGFTINNVAPSVSATLNSEAAISLTESTTTSVEIVADVTDDNGCLDQAGIGDEVPSVKAYLYRSGVAYTGCDTSGEANANYCYPEISCKVTSSCSAGLTSYSCTAEVQYYADPTTANTLFPTENWLSTAKATDDDSAVGTGVSTGVELNTLVGGDTTPTTLDFGSLAVGGSNDPLDKTLTHFPTGNVGIDITIKANTASMCTNYSTCTGGTPIPISYQKYSLSSSTAYSSGTILTTTAVESEINIGKQTTSTAPTKQTWWGIYIPSATLPGVYNGLNVIGYVIGETSGW